MQYRCRRSFVCFLGSLGLLLGAACTGQITDSAHRNSSQGGQGSRDGAGGVPGDPPVGAACSAREGRPQWQLSTNTAYQMRTIVEQVFGAGILDDDQVRSMLENLPATPNAKGFLTEDKAIAGQFVDGLVVLAGRLGALAAEQSEVRQAIEAFAEKNCGGTTDLVGACGADLARKIAVAFARGPVDPDDFDFVMKAYAENRTAYQEPRAYAAFVASILLSAQSAMRFDTAEYEASGAIDANTMGARLAMTLTGGLPDGALRETMQDGSILQPDVRTEQAKRLLRTDFGRRTLRHFVDQWLNLTGLKSPPGAQGYVATREESDAVAQAARDEVGKLFEDAVLEKGGTLADFYGTADVVPDHPWLAAVYETDAGGDITPAGAPDRGGLLTRAAFNLYGAFGEYLPLAHRGYAIKVTMLCGTIPAIPDNIDLSLPPDAPDVMSSREYFETLTETGVCLSCHAAMNPYGYAMSAYSVTGASLLTEMVKNRDTAEMVEVDIVDEAELLIDREMKDIPDATALSEALGESRQAQACFAHRFDQFAVGQKEDFLCDDGETAFPVDNLSLEDTILAYVTSSAFGAR